MSTEAKDGTTFLLMPS